MVALALFLTLEQSANCGCLRRYQCAQAKMRGKVVPCKAAPLILKTMGVSNCAAGKEVIW